MKIAIVAEIINYHSGARAPLEIAKHLAKRNHVVTVYAYDYWQDQEATNDMVKSGVSVITLHKVSIPFVGKYITACSLFTMLKKSSPQVIAYAGTLPFFLACTLTRLPILLMYHGIQPDAYLEKRNPDEPVSIRDSLFNQIANLYIYFTNAILIFLSTDIVTISKFAAKEVESLYHKKVPTVIYLGTTSLLTKKQLNKKEKTSITILSVSRITPYKGFHIILEAIKKIKTKKNIVLTIAGSQPRMNYIRYLKQLGGKNVRIILEPSDPELAKLYQQADFCVTADRYLYFGLSIFEAGFFNKPTIALNQAAASEVIQHERTGFVAKNLHELARYMTILINDTKLTTTLGKNANELAKKLSWDYCAGQWEKAIANVVVSYKKR